ncbi:MAG: hypothetical protein R2731_14585 [Nocardioides sp.]
MHTPTAERVTSAVVVGAALAAAALRLPMLAALPAPDEGGFLLVAGQWHAHGGRSTAATGWTDHPC